MPSDTPSEPDQPGLIIYVGQDRTGHWLVQDSAGRLEGRFISYAAAMSYARAERDIYHAAMAIAPSPMTPLVSLAPIGAREHALARAA